MIANLASAEDKPLRVLTFLLSFAPGGVERVALRLRGAQATGIHGWCLAGAVVARAAPRLFTLEITWRRYIALMGSAARE
jgi:hypothetical protein